LPPTTPSQTSSRAENIVTPGQLADRKLRHGFKAQAKRLAIRVRKESGHDPTEPLDIDAVAVYLRARVVGLTRDQQGLVGDRHLEQLVEIDTGAFSGVTIPLDGDRRLILVNDSHDEFRQRSSATHEFGHVVLAHDAPPPFRPDGCREMDADVEAEANYFGSVLLVPEQAVMRLMRQGLSVDEAADVMRVSTAMMRWRVNAEGARKRLRRR